MATTAPVVTPPGLNGSGSPLTDAEGQEAGVTLAEPLVEEVATADYSAGEEIYGKTCKACHQATGKGIPGAFPPLAESDFLLEDKNRAIKIVLEGLTGEITVNGNVFNGVMTPQAISDEEVVDVLNYVLNSWGNEGGEITLEDVAAQK